MLENKVVCGSEPRAGTGRVDAILMTSGFSSRYPSGDKSLLPFRGMPLAEHTLKPACTLPENFDQ